jgi:hypothetical protein
MFVFVCPIIARSQWWLFVLRANTDQISVFALRYPYLPSNIRILPNSTSGICAVVSKLYVKVQGKIVFQLLHDIFHIGLVSARDSHIKQDSEAGVLMPGTIYGKFHVIIYLSHILHWLFSSIYFYIAEKIFELTNCENKSLRELPLFNSQMFLLRVWFQKGIPQCRSVHVKVQGKIVFQSN